MTVADSPSVVVISAGVRLGMVGTAGQALPMAKRTDPRETKHALQTSLRRMGG